jgi:hypothetical protein
VMREPVPVARLCTAPTPSLGEVERQQHRE